MIKIENNRGAEGNESINKIGIGLSIAVAVSLLQSSLLKNY